MNEKQKKNKFLIDINKFFLIDFSNPNSKLTNKKWLRKYIKTIVIVIFYLTI